ncbi:hypothetical protein [uncultured Paludibaculum sp.]|uniref:hypothetical protein n=1 Tax=uncultured Paludibaculum sp. TaxID=1765020 RepID=UPI002AAB9ACA|nr:hypothetical protein [uncultured Paludibaculum sp.]
MRDYILSLPERILRSATALAGGLLNQIGESALPIALRRTRLYRSLVEATLRFLIEQVGEVEGVFPVEGKLAEDFLMRRTAGNGIELIGILTFRASPVWVLAALADLSGAGRSLIAEIAESLKQEGLIRPETNPHTMDQILDALEETAGRAAETINTPPLDTTGLRAEWAALQQSARGLAPSRFPGIETLERSWRDLRATAQREQRSAFELSALLALDAVTQLPRNVAWLGRSSLVAARTTGEMVAENILEHYSETLESIRTQGLTQWWMLQFRPYLRAAAGQFSPAKSSWTQRVLQKRRSARPLS